MHILSGKTIIFTDLHCGLSGNKISRLNICVKVIKELVSSIVSNNVRNVIFGGDWYHSRSTLDVNTINVAFKLIQALSKHANVYLICGNHDIFMKNSTDINSINMFRNTANVYVIDKPEEIELNQQKCLFAPWLSDLSVYADETFDLMIGHFEISSKYLIQSYIEDNLSKQKASKKQISKINTDDLLSDGETSEKKSNGMIGNFVNLVKRGGIIYAGHIHKHKEFISHERKFIFVGSPYQQTIGEIDSICGYYILDEHNKPLFQEITSTPRHIKIIMSDAVSGSFDFKTISNAIIQKIYDVEVDAKAESAVNQKINDFRPYEELLPDYQVQIGSNEIKSDNSSLDLIKKSKIDYMRNYVDNIDQSALDEQHIIRQKLFEMLESYYKKVTEA